jgi:Xaa-Pro aminopeptidase
MLRSLIIVTLMLIAAATTHYGQKIGGYTIMAERDRALWVDTMLEYRIDQMLPDLMRREGIDMWIIISREYNEDPVMKTMLPASWLSARRRTMMVFYDDGASVEKIAIARYDVGKLLKGSWNIDVYPDQWEALKTIVDKYNPKRIGVNMSEYTGLADGLVATERDKLVSTLGPELSKRIVSADKLAIGWLETRSQIELTFYKDLCAISRAIIKEAFSPKYLKVGKTTTEDVEWRLRQITTDLGLEVWFHPTVAIQRADKENFEHLRAFSGRPADQVVQYGDLMHVDFGITYNRLNTDQQQHFYVLKPQEKDAPQSLKNAFKTSSRLQDLLTDNFAITRSGNEILRRTLDEAKSEGMTASVYTHPIGFHGHAAGPTIGLWDQQGGVPGAGDYIVYPNTAYSIELNTATEIPEWGKIIRIMLEEDGYYDGKRFNYMDGRQESLYLLRLK